MLKLAKNADAEMQYVMGVSTQACLESDRSSDTAIACFESAVALDPEYTAAVDALAKARNGERVADSLAGAAGAEAEQVVGVVTPTNSPTEGAAPAGFEWGATY